ncbi:polysaccharide deacetylase family protein (PEP-CTERM system associated) [Paenibacillus endophyticus]|uniref:Polysaccharide deacetylase family protein (PEP-CTERM system associated) n=1 Tax=Paenibacillus endophyticus TaxID=1294268 RepID=A0A7W5CEM1_9BACL|nr:polysaccharide deacetylase family protein [Paenibacillus endophyticus]MBB3156223.1 polysaccharide deacetylase family protein (PEP-CTERM system associated) [Paenibacillus endophyticus]
MRMAFTVDVEDWFCSPDLSLSEWEGYALRLEKPVHQILDLLDEHAATGTFFTLGWIAERKPELIKEIHRRGHEIASHGYSHRLVYKQSSEQFRQDIRMSKSILEQLLGAEVHGYRAPCFSMTDWGLDILVEEGFMYDSSLIPNTFNKLYAKFDLAASNTHAYKVREALWELPLPVYDMNGIHIPWGGGGYFRIYPYAAFRLGARKIIKKRDAFVFYIHPYDLDHDQPHIYDTSKLNSFRRYYGLAHTDMKLKQLLSDFKCMSIRSYYPQVGGERQVGC